MAVDLPGVGLDVVDEGPRPAGPVDRRRGTRSSVGCVGAVSRDTLDRWIRRYRAGGFDELVPTARVTDPRTDAGVLEMAAGLKRENPQRTAAQVQRILRASSGWSPSESTLLRLFHRLELMGPPAGVGGEVFGRFEAAEVNER